VDVELPEEAMLPCPTTPYLPVAGKAPEIQAELVAENIVQVRSDRSICQEKHIKLVDWILDNN